MLIVSWSLGSSCKIANYFRPFNHQISRNGVKIPRDLNFNVVYVIVTNITNYRLWPAGRLSNGLGLDQADF